MTQREVITETMIEAAITALERRIAEPPLLTDKRYSRREAFLKLRTKTREALAAGHSLETVLDDLKGIGLGMTLSTARQYLKPGRKTNKRRAVTRVKSAEKPPTRPVAVAAAQPTSTSKGTFTVVEDDKEI